MKPNGLDLHPSLLQQFLVLVESGELDPAAGRLAISPGALKKAMARLERQLGTRLFVRDAPSLQLTAEGDALKAPARRVVSAATRFKAGMRATSDVLRVAHSSSVDTLAAVLDRYAESHPRVTVEEQVLPCHAQLSALRERAIDVAVCLLDGAPPEDCHAELLRLDPILAAVAPKAGVAPLSVDPVRTLAYVGDTRGEWPALDELVAAYERAAGCTLRHVDVLIGAGQHVATLERTGASVFLTIASSRTAPTDRRLVGLVPLQPYFPWSLVWPADASAAVTAFVATARSVAADKGWLAVDRLPGAPWIPDDDDYHRRQRASHQPRAHDRVFPDESQ